MNNIKILLLRNNKLEDNDICHLSLFLNNTENFKNLEVLDLSSNNIRNQGVVFLDSNIAKDKKITIYLSRNFIRDKEFIKTNNNITFEFKLDFYESQSKEIAENVANSSLGV
jgi:hypothetical protein